jgi:two-component system, response regulator PdtaR
MGMIEHRTDTWKVPLVLVVEDEALLAMELEALVTAMGWRVLGPARSVEEATELLERETPNAAVLDINLKDELVTPVAEALRSESVPFVVASAFDPEELGIESLAHAPYVAKPISENRLVKVLQGMLG